MKATSRSSDPKPRKVTPPSPSYMNSDQFATYLSELRQNRIARPGGARPQPAGARPAPTTTRSDIGPRVLRHSIDATPPAESISAQPATSSQRPSTTAGSVSSRYSVGTAHGRDYYPANKASAPLKPSDVVPTTRYMERGQRWMEKEESHSLRGAMDAMSLRKATKKAKAHAAHPAPPAPAPPVENEEESRVYDAALDEAADLVWKHRNGVKPPEPNAPYRYRPHLRKNSYAHARTASVNDITEEVAASGMARDLGTRSVSGSSSEGDSHSRRTRPSMESSRTQEGHQESKPYGSLNGHSAAYSDVRRRSSMKRNISGEVQRPFSGDQIWEEPETSSTNVSVKPAPVPLDTLSSKPPPNPRGHIRFQSSREDVGAQKQPPNRIEIYRNPPSQSRNPSYLMNDATSSPPVEDDGIERKNGIEVRSPDLRQATSRSLKDRSAKLPEPTAVSDSPGRPIVSFNANWRAPEETTDSNPDRLRQQDQKRQAGPVGIPSINVEEDNPSQRQPATTTNVPSISIGAADDIPNVPIINVPTIAIDDAPPESNVPIIVTPGDTPKVSTRPLPAPGQQPRRAQRPPRSHWSPAPGATSRVNAICHECGFPIEGRFVALRGSPERFHPQCFSCFNCNIALEAMEISPEPDHVRAQRLERLHRREAGEILEETPGATAAEDGDDRLRFYCHLDWHEQFAPRCKHCTTPIMGEHVVALGEHWHFGHFFCAECGDPFEHGMTHIEKDGYAWCINCQTKRTERRAPKCRKCKVAVIGQYIQALGYEWHDHCFRCADCQGGFDDGQIFPIEVPDGTVVLCTGCRAKELKL